MKLSKRLRRDALKYLRYKDSFEALGEEVIERFRQETLDSFNSLIEVGSNIKFVDYDPYGGIDDLVKDYESTNTLLISNLNNDSKLLPGDLNLKFRALHDAIHYELVAPFNYKGELAVYNVQKDFYPKGIYRDILYSEVVLQAAYKEYFGVFPAKQKIVL